MTYLDGKNVSLQVHDLAVDPPPRALLERVIGEKDPNGFLNSRSPKYKELGLGQKKLTKNEVVDMMLQEVNLIRRPLLVRGSEAVFGFNEEAFQALLED